MYTHVIFNIKNKKGSHMKRIFPYLVTASMCIATSQFVVSKDPDQNRTQQITVHDKKFVVSITHDAIAKRVKELAQQINKDYAGKKPVLIAPLKGAFIFLADLARELDAKLECEIDFIQIASYGNATTSSGSIELSKALSSSVADRHVIIVEDIVDSGLSIKYAVNLISKSNPQSIRIATFLHKNLCNLDFPIDYVGFNIEPEFVIGYGLDYAQLARNLKDVYKLVE